MIDYTIVFLKHPLRTKEAMPIKWATSMMNLANAYSDRTRGERAENIEQAIFAYEQALTVMTQEAMPVDWAQTMNNLANTYKDRIRGDRAENIEQAILAFEKVIQVRTKEDMPIEWAASMNNLANAYKDRIRGSQIENIKKSVSAYKNALSIISKESVPVQWSAIMHNLAAAYSLQVRDKQARNPELTISTYKDALNVIRDERAENLEKAISTYKASLMVRTREAMSAEWAQTMNGLATAYYLRIRGDRAENIEQAIKSYEQALSVRTQAAMPIEWSQTTNNLAIAYKERIEGDRAENIEQAIKAYEKALTVMTTALPDDCRRTGTILANLYSYESRWTDATRTYDLALQAAEICYQRSDFLDSKSSELSTTADLPRRAAYAYAKTGDLPKAIETLEQGRARGLSESLSRDRADLAQLQTLAPHLYTQYQEITSQLRNLERGDRDRMVSTDRDRVPEDLINTTRKLRQSLDQTLIQIRQVPRYEDFLTPTKWEDIRNAVTSDRPLVYLVTTPAGSLALVLNPPSSPSPFSLGEKGDRAAIADASTLAGRNRKVPQALLNRARELRAQQTPAEAILWECLRDRQLNNAKFRRQHNINSIIADFYCHSARLIIEVDGSIHAIRKIEDQNRDRWSTEHGFTVLRFTNEQIFNELETVLTAIANTIPPATSLPSNLPSPPGRGAGGEGQPSAIAPIWLNDFTNTDLNNLLQTWFAAYNNSGGDRQTWLNTIDQTTQQLWEPLIGPMVEQVQALGFDRITLIPTGYLSLLPLHAAWTEDAATPTGRRYALDPLQITYAPNAKSLTAAKAIADRVQANSILAIDNPKQDLPSSEQEVQAAIATFQNPTVLRHDQATVEQVRSQLPNVAIAHFSCHGTANLREPLQSGLLMSDGLLTLKDIFALNLADLEKGNSGLRLAILSACETGMIGTENADEAISLPTGLLQAGVAAVVASLWAVSDLSTMLLLTKFYDLWRSHKYDPDQALRQAQIWLRDTTNAEKIQALKTVLPEFPDSPPPEAPRDRFLGLPESTARDLYTELAWEDPNERAYAHPFHWAAFGYTGV